MMRVVAVLLVLILGAVAATVGGLLVAGVTAVVGAVVLFAAFGTSA